MKLIPTSGQCIVVRDQAEKKTPGGIVIPEKAQEKQKRGKIIAVGKGKLLQNGQFAPVELVEGTTAVFGEWSGKEVELDGETFLILNQDDVLAVLEVD